MTASTVIELIATVSTLLGAGAVLVTKLTRIAVAVEGLVESLRTITTTVQAHETRLAHVEGQLQAPLPLAVPVVPVVPPAVQPPP